MILFVDNEHASTFDDPAMEWLLAARTKITYRLQDLSGQVCLLQRYQDVSVGLVEELDIRAVFISGHGAEPERYDPADRVGLQELVLSGAVPVFGFCGGLQFIGETLGVAPERVGAIEPGEQDPAPSYQPGWRKEVGYQSVEIVADHPLTAGLGQNPVFRQAHTWELKDLPEGFVNLARSALTTNQLLVNDELKIVGSQFHPEYWTDDHGAGERLLKNFCQWSDLNK